MNELARVLIDLFLVFLLARIAAEVFERLGLPVVLGELFVGILIGPNLLHIIGVPNAALVARFGSVEGATSALGLVYDTLGQLGLIVLLFYIGLETSFDRLLAVLPRAFSIALPGAALSFIGAAAFSLALHESLDAAAFTGAALAATSVAITARILQELGLIRSSLAEAIMGAALIDDVLGLLLLAVVSGLSKNGTIDAYGAGLLLAEAVGFFAFIAFAARRAVGRFSIHLERLRMSSPGLSFAVILMLGFSALAANIGLAGVVGAFLAGIILSDSRERLELGEQIRPIYEFLAPFFFVFTGAKVDLGVFHSAHTAWLFLGLCVIAFAGKFIGCGLGSLGLGRRAMTVIGVAMGSRGEIGFAVASAGLALHVIDSALFSIIVLVSVTTALVSTVLLRLLLREPAEFAAPG